jgi:hypothetical protein
MKIIQISIFYFLGLFCVANAKDVKSNSNCVALNGTWWSNVGYDERVGSLYALDDCFTFYASPRLLFDGKWSDYERKISLAYQSGKIESSVPIEDVFKKFGKQAVSSKFPKISDRYGDEFWRAHNNDARTGFVEAYISCRTYLRKDIKYPGSIKLYVEKINDLYNADDRNGEDAAEYSGSVASAIDRVRDEMIK